MYEKTLAMMEEQRKSSVYSGYSTSFITRDTVIRRTEGLAAILPAEEQLTQDYVFDVASLTKVILTTTVLFRLIDRNKINLGDAIKEYLPEYIDSKVTIREILTHTSGIDTWIEDRDKLSSEELRKAYLKQLSGPNRNTLVKYTDTGFILLGFMLEAIYNEPLADIFTNEVFIPLHMDHSFMYQVPFKQKAVPTGQLPDSSILRGIVHDSKARILMPNAGHAGLFSSTNDIEKFVQMYLKNDGSYLSKECIEQTQINQTFQLGESRGLGWRLIEKNHHSFIFHTGYTGTFILMDIVNQMGWIFLSNRVHPVDYREAYVKSRDALIECFIKEYTE